MDWLAAARIHPVDQIITKGLSMLPLYMLGFSEVAIGIFSAIYFWHSLLLHANVRISFGPLRWLIASPEFHHWHHANQRDAYDKNFAGQLSILDKLFGTIHMPAGQRPAKIRRQRPGAQHLYPHLLYPFMARTRKSQPGRQRAASGLLICRSLGQCRDLSSEYYLSKAIRPGHMAAY